MPQTRRQQGSSKGRRTSGNAAKARHQSPSAGRSRSPRPSHNKSGRQHAASSARSKGAGAAQAHSSRTHTGEHRTHRQTGSQRQRMNGGAQRQRERMMDEPNSALSVLRADHQRVRKLLGELTSTHSADRRRALLNEVETEVKRHTEVEENIFYPAYRDAVQTKEDKKLFFEATEEHHVVDLVLPELRSEEPSSEEFAAKAKVLKDLIEHHIEEEETEMFPRARKAMTPGALAALGDQIEHGKEEQSRSWNPIKAVSSLMGGGET